MVVREENKLQEDMEYKRLTLMYTAALTQLEAKMETINEEFKTLHKYNPIEHVSSRIKSKESIYKKLKKKGLEPTYENLVKTINDIAGIRIVCSFIPDIFKIVEMLENMTDITVIKKKDYVTTPKINGYSSYHLIVSVPVSLSMGTIRGITIAVPPIDEQRKISEYLSRKIAFIDKVVRGKESIIENLLAYKNSLIYEIVTGKKEV